MATGGPRRGRRHWQGKRGEQAAVYGNRRRIRGARGKQLLRRRGELLERTFAHVYDTGGMRRGHLRREIGGGTPRGLQDLVNRLFFCFGAVWVALESLWESSGRLPATSADRFPMLPPPA